MGCDDSLRIARAELLKNGGEVPGLRRTLIEFRLLTAKNETWHAGVVGAGQLVQESQEVGALEAVAEPRKVPFKIALASDRARERLFDANRPV